MTLIVGPVYNQVVLYAGCGPERCQPSVPGLINVHLVPHRSQFTIEDFSTEDQTSRRFKRLWTTLDLMAK